MTSITAHFETRFGAAFGDISIRLSAMQFTFKYQGLHATKNSVCSTNSYVTHACVSTYIFFNDTRLAGNLWLK